MSGNNTKETSKKFNNMYKTATGEDRAQVSLQNLNTLWFNTGTLCNLECKNCYIKSSPRNDSLVYINENDVTPFLDEIKSMGLKTNCISFTGGEPFINPHMLPILKICLEKGFECLVLTNAYKVIKRVESSLLDLNNTYKDNLKIRVSLDHHTKKVHDNERGQGALDETIKSLHWLIENNFNISIAGRSLINETDEEARSGYQKLFNAFNLKLESTSQKLVIFPEMNSKQDVPEITTSCWNILGISPNSMMCATERMVIKRKGQTRPVVLPCTLIAYDKQFELGHSLKEAKKTTYLNHKFCAEFCVLGGASCSTTK